MTAGTLGLLPRWGHLPSFGFLIIFRLNSHVCAVLTKPLDVAFEAVLAAGRTAVIVELPRLAASGAVPLLVHLDLLPMGRLLGTIAPPFLERENGECEVEQERLKQRVLPAFVKGVHQKYPPWTSTFHCVAGRSSMASRPQSLVKRCIRGLMSFTGDTPVQRRVNQAKIPWSLRSASMKVMVW